ncbi:helix-turn-helix domain-containing protein [Paraprevotella clara]|uniref:helix-turn-helix domain-containing protein n=1 Tax=Paraprevotella clara TaxID=454154 RepID=UPI003AB7C475
MNKTIMTNDEWAVDFMEQLDTMLDGIESMNEKSRTSFGNERFLTDKEVSAWLKVSRRTLQDYRNNGMVSYYQLGGKILYKESDIEKLVMGGYQNAYRMKT